jgi:TatD DNase family protein
LVEENKQIEINPGIMHAFEGTQEEAQIFRDFGFFIGIGGAITYSPSRVDPAIVTGLPISSFVFETDAPYLSPMPWRGKRNEPSFLRSTVEFFSNKKGMEFSELCKISTESANMVFQLEQF